MRGGVAISTDDLATLRDRAAAQLASLPARLRQINRDEVPEPYQVAYSEWLLERSTPGRGAQPVSVTT
jgi:hypothetical protein